MSKLLVGDHVLKSGYKGVIVREYSPGVYEVKLDSGLVVVPEHELKLDSNKEK